MKIYRIECSIYLALLQLVDFPGLSEGMVLGHEDYRATDEHARIPRLG